MRPAMTLNGGHSVLVMGDNGGDMVEYSESNPIDLGDIEEGEKGMLTINFSQSFPDCGCGCAETYDYTMIITLPEVKRLLGQVKIEV